jgi:hypothetical protein
MSEENVEDKTIETTEEVKEEKTEESNVLEENKTTETTEEIKDEVKEEKVEEKTEETKEEIVEENKTNETTEEIKVEEKVEEKTEEIVVENKTNDKVEEKTEEIKVEEKKEEIKVVEEKTEEIKVVEENKTKNEEKPGETNARRNNKFKEKLLETPFDGIYTLNGIFEKSAEKNAKRPCMGYRPLGQMIKSKKLMDDGTEKDWETPEYKPTVWKTYEEVAKLVLDLSSGLVSLTGGKNGDM